MRVIYEAISHNHYQQRGKGLMMLKKFRTTSSSYCKSLKIFMEVKNFYYFFLLERNPLLTPSDSELDLCEGRAENRRSKMPSECFE